MGIVYRFTASVFTRFITKFGEVKQVSRLSDYASVRGCITAPPPILLIVRATSLVRIYTPLVT